MSKGWSAADLGDLSGKTIVVTGANSGLGFETSRALAGAGAHVMMACRDEARARSARDAIVAEHAGASVELGSIDLADLDSVRGFASWVDDRHRAIDVLVNNAGVMAVPQRKTKQGFELHLGINHLGPFALTGLLLPRLLAAEAARVVTVSSLMHQLGEIDFEDLDSAHEYERWAAYSRSKLANLLFAYELQRRFTAANASAISVAAHPGYAATNLQTSASQGSGSKLVGGVLRLGNRLFAQSPAQGALPILYAAVAPDVRGGAYYGPAKLEVWGAPKQVESNARSHDVSVARRLWDVSAERTGVQYDFGV
jgi:NAD(P)-dependent dehydrogenase (short-subunit alcohol dehydrogenase family)